MEDSGWNQMERVLDAVRDNRVPGVGAAGESHDTLGFVGQIVNDLSLPFVAPLGTDNDYVHGYLLDFKSGQAPPIRRSGHARTPYRSPDGLILADLSRFFNSSNGFHREIFVRSAKKRKKPPLPRGAGEGPLRLKDNPRAFPVSRKIAREVFVNSGSSSALPG
jgi:hypothetical protein